MIDDGRGHLVHIPAYLISKADGDKFKTVLKTDNIVVRSSLQISNTDNIVHYELWYASAFDFIDWDLKGM